MVEVKVRYSCMKFELSEFFVRLNIVEFKIVKFSEEFDFIIVRFINLELKYRRYFKREEYFEDKVEIIE